MQLQGSESPIFYMNYLIILFSTATIVAGIIIVISPESIFGMMRRKTESTGLHVLAVIIRIVIGVALIMCASESKYPTAILTLGWISIVAATVLGVMGRTNFKRVMLWALSLKPVFGRFGGFIAILFGCFLIYAVVK